MNSFAFGKMGELWKQQSRLNVFKKIEPDNLFLRGLEKDINRLIRLCGETPESVLAFDPWAMVPA
jgi:hypothetical protein